MAVRPPSATGCSCSHSVTQQTRIGVFCEPQDLLWERGVESESGTQFWGWAQTCTQATTRPRESCRDEGSEESQDGSERRGAEVAWAACSPSCFFTPSLWSAWSDKCVLHFTFLRSVCAQWKCQEQGLWCGASRSRCPPSSQIKSGGDVGPRMLCCLRGPVHGCEGAGAGSQPLDPGLSSLWMGSRPRTPALASWATSFVAQGPGVTWAALLHLCDLPVAAMRASGSHACLPEPRCEFLSLVVGY